MEKLVDALTSFPSSPNLTDAELSKQCKELLVNCLYKVTANNLASNISGTSLLDLLNPGVNSLGYVYVLAAKLEINGHIALETIWGHIVGFLERYDNQQTKHAPKEFRRVVDIFCNYASDVGRPILAVKPLKKALLRSNPSQFSFMHPIFVRLCLQAKCYRDAIPVLDIDVFDFPVSKGSKESELNGKGFEVVYRDVLEFYLYGAMLYMGVKKWRRAMDYLCHVLATPGAACSAIQVEAYKKFILVGLLLDGRMPTLPKSTSAPSSRIFKSLAKPYEAFANAFKSGDRHLFQLEIGLTAEVFRADENSGLAAQCMDVFRRVQIVALRDTYVTLGVGEIAQKGFDVTGRGGEVGTKEETERVILGMIERDEISASLSQSGSDQSTPQTTVYFDSTPIEEARNLRALEEQIQRIVALNTQVKQMDRKLGLSKDYIQFASKQGKSSGGNAPPSLDSDMMDLEYGTGPAWGDEDTEETVMQDFDERM